jgi:hypothetical protein
MVPLLVQAQRLQQAAMARKTQQTNVYVARGYQTRRDELQPLVARATACRKLLRLLREAELPLALPPGQLAAAAHKLRQVQTAFAKEPESVMRAGVLETPAISQLLRECEQALASAWQAFVSPPADNDPLVEVLQRYPPLKKSATRLADFRLELRRAATAMPKSRTDIARVRKLHEQQHEQLSQLEGEGLSRVVLEFLKRCSSGVPLRELTENPELLRWIEEHDLLDHFTIRG